MLPVDCSRAFARPSAVREKVGTNISPGPPETEKLIAVVESSVTLLPCTSSNSAISCEVETTSAGRAAGVADHG